MFDRKNEKSIAVNLSKKIGQLGKLLSHRSEGCGYQSAPPGVNAREVPIEHRYAATAHCQRLRASVKGNQRVIKKGFIMCVVIVKPLDMRASEWVRVTGIDSASQQLN